VLAVVPQSAMIVRDLGFDGIDINMGCPEAVVNNQGSGAALILQPTLAERIITECKRGAGDLPVSVKTRIGFHEIAYEDWVRRLLDTEPEVLTIHGRTRDEMSKVPAHWDAIGDIAHLAKMVGSDALILGNGDVKNVDEARKKVEQYGIDGVMLGRALFGNPWLFQGHDDTTHISVREKIEVIRKHTQYFDELLSQPKLASFTRMRKFYGSYLKGVPNARSVREKLANVKNPQEAFTVLDGCLEYLERAAEEAKSAELHS
jgi:tRNA-dihydrouridine synthase